MGFVWQIFILRDLIGNVGGYLYCKDRLKGSLSNCALFLNSGILLIIRNLLKLIKILLEHLVP